MYKIRISGRFITIEMDEEMIFVPISDLDGRSREALGAVVESFGEVVMKRSETTNIIQFERGRIVVEDTVGLIGIPISELNERSRQALRAAAESLGDEMDG